MTTDQINKQKNTYELLQPGHDLFMRIIQTLPEKIYEGGIIFVAHGIKVPQRDNFSNYLKMCASNNVIPFTRIAVEYEDAVELIVPKREADYFVDIDVNFSKEKQEAVSKAILKGGKIHQMSISFPMFNNRFEQFRKKGLSLLVESCYQISSGKLHFTEPNRMGSWSRNESFIEFRNDELGTCFRVVHRPSLDEWVKEVVYR
ncbi:hypothetical protein HY484_00760 [Candidatus Woesearchaeota archaeon]|nr:hypothetical protein [Candidatus Woesearchaeota archaeon]